jgi:hypothetical protein
MFGCCFYISLCHEAQRATLRFRHCSSTCGISRSKRRSTARYCFGFILTPSRLHVFLRLSVFAPMSKPMSIKHQSSFILSHSALLLPLYPSLPHPLTRLFVCTVVRSSPSSHSIIRLHCRPHPGRPARSRGLAESAAARTDDWRTPRGAHRARRTDSDAATRVRVYNPIFFHNCLFLFSFLAGIKFMSNDRIDGILSTHFRNSCAIKSDRC